MRKAIIFVFFVLAGPLICDEPPYLFKGTHFLASYYDCDPDAIRDLEALKGALIEGSEKCGATILKKASYVFEPDGLTMVLLLSESHASIHTYPEYNACFVDLFTCGDRCSFEIFHDVLNAYLCPKKLSHQVITRE